LLASVGISSMEGQFDERGRLKGSQVCGLLELLLLMMALHPKSLLNQKPEGRTKSPRPLPRHNFCYVI
jgi:hypothetical protein